MWWYKAASPLYWVERSTLVTIFATRSLPLYYIRNYFYTVFVFVYARCGLYNTFLDFIDDLVPTAELTATVANVTMPATSKASFSFCSQRSTEPRESFSRHKKKIVMCRYSHSRPNTSNLPSATESNKTNDDMLAASAVWHLANITSRLRHPHATILFITAF